MASFAADALRTLEANLIDARGRLLDLNQQYEPLVRPSTPPQQAPNAQAIPNNPRLPNHPEPLNQVQPAAPVNAQANREEPEQGGRQQARQIPLSPNLTVAEIERLLRQIQERRQ